MMVTIMLDPNKHTTKVHMVKWGWLEHTNKFHSPASIYSKIILEHGSKYGIFTNLNSLAGP